ncbi:MAG: hypothetical protein GF313_02645 [Caldithrix sp.]|nr:hypothetical protein [Caldithrix sp.]
MPSKSLPTTICYKYTFELQGDRLIQYELNLDIDNLRYLPGENTVPSNWAKLDNHQCKLCPLEVTTHPYCPIAKNLDYLLPPFKQSYSYEPTRVKVECDRRTYVAETTVQKGLSSMIGIIMVSSGCPIMEKLKPMVRFHLPFASTEETIYRSISTYLLQQYFHFCNDRSPDWELNGLIQIYKDVEQVNVGMANRFRALGGQDAEINALVALDIFAKELPTNIRSQLKDLQHWFDLT